MVVTRQLLVAVTGALVVLAGCAGAGGAAAGGRTGQTPSGARDNRIPPLRGRPVAAHTPGPNWREATAPEAGIELRHPPDWQALRTADGAGLALYPPSAPADRGFALIAVDVAPDVPFDRAAVQGGRPYRFAGLDGVWQDPAGFAVPTEAVTIQAPYRGGTITITATTGPVVDVTPQLEAILQTLRLSP